MYNGFIGIMPTYDYRCKACGYEFEEIQSMSADRLIICPQCAEPKLKRLMSSGVGLLFKGSGFYQTDYKKSNVSPTTSDQKTESKTQSKPETKPESKSDAKPETKPSTDSTSSTDKK